MAFIYRYYIKNKKVRDNTNLLEFSEDIIRTIKDYYIDILKDCRVEDNYYEYKLHYSVSSGTLNGFGKRLLENCAGLKAIWDTIKYENKTFFTRKMSEYYALINFDNDEQIIDIELIDSLDFDDPERLDRQADENIRNYMRSHNIELYDVRGDIGRTEIARTFYLDVFSLEISKSDLENYLGEFELSKGINIVKMKGYHRKNPKEVKIIAELDAEPLRNSRLKNIVSSNTTKGYTLENGFDINKIKKLEAAEIERVKRTLDEHITPAGDIENIYTGDYKNVNFTVHNVGQGLATSFSLQNEPPFLYFDLGVSEGRNIRTMPPHMTVDVSQKPAIILSHIHADHWYGLTIFTTAFECDWYIPQQRFGRNFNKRCAEIIVSGGSVSYITAPISLSFGTVFLHSTSKYDATHTAKHEHDTGLAMRMRLTSRDNEDVNILLAGDQRYDFMPQSYLQEIDILVASHHGGHYSWSNRKDVYDDIPVSTGVGQIIYSYADGNSHGHPSNRQHYNDKGWTIVHNTAEHLDYTLR